jgi:hypothetical protein
MVRLRRTALVGLSILALAACTGSSPRPPTPLGTLADAPFRPGPNGFGFKNYGDFLSDNSAPTNLTAPDISTMFGDGVCADARLRRCDLTPEAQAWLDSTNQEMSGGHCFGFSIAAELLWQGKANVTTFGAPNTPGLNILQNEALQRLIAYNWATQLLGSEQSQRVTGTPNQILAKLRQVLTPNPPETYTVTIWKSDGTGGHAVTPYALENDGGGMFKVLIYDNNWPN